MWTIDNRIATSSVELHDFALSRLFLKNDANFLWFILVPRIENVQEIYQLTQEQRACLIEEIADLSRLINAHCHPDKLNVGALGNIVSQLHIHVVARFNDDLVWPHGVWQASSTALPYKETELLQLVKDWQERLK